MRRALLSLIWLPLVSLVAGPAAAAEPGVVKAEFVYEKAPFPQCHASTLAETKDGLAAAWFGGTHEKNPDVGVWVSLWDGESWSTPKEVANGVESEQKRYPCWNPVLYQHPDGPLVLFYKVGPSPSTWWGVMKTSDDGGRSWSTALRLPDGQAGPIKNKPVLLKDGRLLCGSSTEDQGWRVHMEWTTDLGKSWKRTKPLNDGKRVHAIQPTILTHADGGLQILCRSRGLGRILQSTSKDQGESWSEFKPLNLPNPNSGIDGLTMRDGRHLLVYNHTRRGRSPLNVAVSKDGQQWSAAVTLEKERGEYSYPSCIQTKDGLIHIAYTWKRKRVKHVVLNLDKLDLRPIKDGAWPE